MSATLTISVSDGVLARLKERAAAAGTTAEAVAAEELEQALPKSAAGPDLQKNGPESRSATDPFLQLAGIITGGPGDVSLRHDEYLGEALLAELRGETP